MFVIPNTERNPKPVIPNTERSEVEESGRG